MTEDELKTYAERLIHEHATDIEWLSIFEMTEEHAPGGDISDEEAHIVADLLNQATVTVSFP